MRRAASGSFQHLAFIEGKEFLVQSWPPGERIDAIKSLDVIDPEQMKDAPDSAHPFPPPLKIVRPHLVPAIERDAPVLAPFLCERVVLKGRLGRRAARPVEHKFARPRENVRAV